MLPNSDQITSLLGDCSLDHIAIAVTNLEASIQFYEQLGIAFLPDREVVVDQKVKVAFAPIDKLAKMELLESTSEDGPIAKFIRDRGAGMHHLCFLVPNLEKKQKELEDKGVRFLYQKGQIGAHQRMVNFIHPKSTGGVLIELSQKLS